MNAGACVENRRFWRPNCRTRGRRIQQLHVAIGDHAYRGVSKTTPEQLALFHALTLPKP